MFIRSERLFLRPGWPEDWEELLAQIADEEVVKHLARAPWPYTAADARAFAAQQQDAGCPHFVITLPSSAEPARIIGSVGLMAREGEVELGYWLARPHWGNGFATEAARAVLSLARTLGHRRISGIHFVDNPASGRVLRKTGFKPTGRVQPRFCLARGGEVMAVEHALELGDPCNCDGGGEGAAAMRAA